jgi:hypothetical protein
LISRFHLSYDTYYLARKMTMSRKALSRRLFSAIVPEKGNSNSFSIVVR